KENYGWKCAVTGIVGRDFLVAAHIVPWSHDSSIRLDPANGICLSVLVDRAFETGHLIISDDLTVKVNWAKVGGDKRPGEALRSVDGVRLSSPRADAPKVDYLRRRRKLVL